MQTNSISAMPATSTAVASVMTRVWPFTMNRDRWYDSQYSIAGRSTSRRAGSRAKPERSCGRPETRWNQTPASGVKSTTASATVAPDARMRRAREISVRCSPPRPMSATPTSWNATPPLRKRKTSDCTTGSTASDSIG